MPAVAIYTGVCIFIDAILNLIETFVLDSRQIIGSAPLFNGGMAIKVIELMILAPLIETIIFQYLIFEILKHRVKKGYIILISAVLFGLSHFYSWEYVLNTFIIGLVLAFAYGSWKNIKIHPLIVVFFVHMFYDLILFFVNI